MEDVFFEKNPNPMWVFDPDSLQIKAVNEAAIAFYGYSRDEMLSLKISDLRPKSEIPRLRKEVERRSEDFNDAGIWLHKKKSGDHIYVRILSYPVEWENKKCKLVVAQDVTREKNIEQRYLIEQELLEVLMQNLPGVFCVFDREGNIYRWNKKMSELTGYSGEEIKQMSPVDFFAEEEQRHVRNAITNAFSNDYTEVKADLLTSTNNKIPFYFRICRADFNGESKLIGIGMDISSLRKAEYEGEQNRLLLNAIMEQAGSVITVKDREGRYQLVNRKYCELFELEAEEVIGKKGRKIYGEDIARTLRESDKKVYENGRAVEIEEDFSFPGGDRSFVVVKYLLRDVPGYEDSICSIATEITEVKKTEKKLQKLYRKEKEKRHRIERINSRLELLKKVSELFARNKDDHQSALEKMAKLLTEEVADICVFDLCRGDDMERVAQELDISEEQANVVQEIRDKYPDFFHNTEVLKRTINSGEAFLVENFNSGDLQKMTRNKDQFELINRLGIRSYFLLPLKVKENVLGVIALIILDSDRKFTEDDLTFLQELADKTALHIENSLINEEMRDFNKKLENQVKERTKQLENINEELESFSYSVSHDLRTPLRAISGYTNLLLEDYSEQLNEEGQEFLAIINNETKRMGTLIDELLSFSRLSRKEKVRKNFSMDVLVHDCFKEVVEAYAIEPSKVDIENMPVVYGDPKLLRQVWINLISNAVKYQENEHNICISVGACRDEQKNQIVFWIKDNGVGFNMKYSDKLFGVFQRLHSEDEFEGTGIGLALVRRIVNRHGGDVWAESKIGEGSTFYFSLPVKQKE